MIDIELVSPPTQKGSDVVSLQAMKEHLRISSSAQDGVINDAVEEAVAMLNGPTGTLNRIILPSKWRIYGSAFPDAGGAMQIPFPPCIEVLSVGYDDGSSPQPIIDTTDYVVSKGDYGTTVARKSGKWPRFTASPRRAFIEFQAGYDEYPWQIKRLVKILAAHNFENREATINEPRQTMTNRQVDFGVQYLTDLLKVPNSYDDWGWTG